MRDRSAHISPQRVCLAVAAAAALVGLSACGADGPDAYTVEVESAAQAPERTLPPTTLAPELEPGETIAPAQDATPANGEVVQVRSLDNSFRVEDIEVVAGTEVWWTNNGRNDHNVLPVDENLEWGIGTEDFTPGDEYRLVFGTPGTYLYYCSIHGTKTFGMIGSVTVVAAEG
jgi:plastocyanin